MKISCQSCNAKYTIADEKVLGKVVKIRCKKCGATIVINGSETSANAGSESAAAPNGAVYDYTQPTGQTDAWTVNVSDGDQRTMSLGEVVAEFRNGTIHEETYCWKDGMADWQPLRELSELYAACIAGPRPSLAPDPGSEGAPNANIMISGIPQATGSSPPAAASDPQAVGSNRGISGFPPASNSGGTTSTGAARRINSRQGGGDLFGGVDRAGSELDRPVSVSASAHLPDVGDANKLTGQRNENSVLFSLAALSKNDSPSDAAPAPTGDASGLIDIRALSAAAHRKDANGTSGDKANFDDIMNLAGGGAFSAPLLAPVIAPPTFAEDIKVDAPLRAGGRNNKTALIAVGAVVGLLAVVGAVFAFNNTSEDIAARPAPSTANVNMNDAPPKEEAPAPPPMAAAAEPNTGATTPSDPAGAGATGDTREPSTTSRIVDSAGKGKGGVAGGKPSKGSSSPSPQAEKDTPAPAPPPKKSLGSLADEMAKSAGTPAGGGGGGAKESGSGGASSAPFDKGQAASALAAVAASLGTCKKSDGPTGQGHVRVTFQPNGTVSTVEVDRPPFAGTAVGGCIAGKFRGAKISAFAGPPMPVGKTFELN